MPYRPDFYIVDNIVGCTGDIKWPDMATVYFESDTEFGHITQHYPRNRGNEGRTTVRNKLVTWDRDQRDYEYVRENRIVEIEDNDGITEVYVLYERLQRTSGVTYRFPFRHMSRNVIYTSLSSEDKDSLAESITNFPELKTFRP
jgi:hypothetical protein